jgi:hypothetical protein
MDECGNVARGWKKRRWDEKGGLELVETREVQKIFSHLKHKDLAGAYPDANTGDLLRVSTILPFPFCRRKPVRGPGEFKKASLYL